MSAFALASCTRTTVVFSCGHTREQTQRSHNCMFCRQFGLQGYAQCTPPNERLHTSGMCPQCAQTGNSAAAFSNAAAVRTPQCYRTPVMFSCGHSETLVTHMTPCTAYRTLCSPGQPLTGPRYDYGVCRRCRQRNARRH